MCNYNLTIYFKNLFITIIDGEMKTLENSDMVFNEL